MDLSKLFEIQKVLRDRIGYNEPDRLDKLILALLVEIGELANEQRTWKFWSKDQTPRTLKSRAPYMDLDDADFYNPLLEEYVDGLHFLLELGIEFNVENVEIKSMKFGNIIDQFIGLYNGITIFKINNMPYIYNDVFSAFIGLGEMLGFTWEQIEQTYLAKNKINHHKQEVGY